MWMLRCYLDDPGNDVFDRIGDDAEEEGGGYGEPLQA